MDHYRESPLAERGAEDPEGRWLWSGIGEGEIQAYDRTACYSGRVSKALAEIRIARCG